MTVSEAVVPVRWPACLHYVGFRVVVDVVEGGRKQSKHREAGQNLAKVLGVGPCQDWRERQGECDEG